MKKIKQFLNSSKTKNTTYQKNSGKQNSDMREINRSTGLNQKKKRPQIHYLISSLKELEIKTINEAQIQ